MDLNKTYLGDCLEVMKDIPDKSIDMILYDLPYGTTDAKWDNLIPMEQLWIQYKRIIKDKGAVVLTASQPFTSMLTMSNLKWYRCEWIWTKNKGSNFLHFKRYPAKVHESVLVFSKEVPNYYPIMILGKPYNVNPKVTGTELYNYRKRVPTISDGLRYPKSIIDIKQLKTDRGLHSTQKPLSLFEYLIKTYTKEGEIVLDNCAGSGTTAIAAINTGRNYICIEKEQKYFDIMNERILKNNCFT